jgi:hypothetical protein
LHFALAWRGDG